MNIEFDQEPGEKSSKGGGSNSRLLLLVLLLLVAVFGYLFYFTDLIKPRQEAQSPEPVQTGQIKQPIPPRPDGLPSGAAPAEQPKPAEATPPAAGQPEPAMVAQEQKAPEKGKAEPQMPVKPAAPAEKKVQPKPAEPAKAVVDAKQKDLQSKTDDKQKTAASATGAKEAKKPAAASAKPKTAAAKTATKKAASATAVKAQTTGKASSAAETGEYTLRIGEYVVPSAMEKDKAKVRDAGLTPVVKEGGRKKEPMVRLLFGEFGDQETARKELQKLRAATVEGFVLNEGGKYRVYAGSYFVKERALKEQERLEALGYRLSLSKASVTVPTLLLTAGKYGSREEAIKDVSRLKKKGLSPSVVANVK